MEFSVKHIFFLKIEKIQKKFTYLPIWLQTSESEQTAPFLKICKTDPDGPWGTSGFGGIKPIFGKFDFWSLFGKQIVITIVNKIIKRIKIVIRINFCFFVRFENKQDLWIKKEKKWWKFYFKLHHFN